MISIYLNLLFRVFGNKITRLLYMNTKGEPTGLTKAFIDYIFSPDGTGFVKKAGYIPYSQK